MILIGATFESPIGVPGSGMVSEFPPFKTGWKDANAEGCSIRIVGDRLEIWVQAGRPLCGAAKLEMDANRIAHEAAAQMVSVPLHRCILRYAGRPEEMPADGARCPAPFKAMAVIEPPPSAIGDRVEIQIPATPPPPSPAAAPRPNHAPTPMRRPPGARGPSKPSNIVRDLPEEEAAEVVKSKRVQRLQVAPGLGGEDDE